MKKIFLLATATAALMACSNNDEPLNNELIAARIIANIGASDTRATGTNWSANDEIGDTNRRCLSCKWRRCKNHA